MMNACIRCWQPGEGKNFPMGLSGCDSEEVLVEGAEGCAVQRRCGGAECAEAGSTNRIGCMVQEKRSIGRVGAGGGKVAGV